MGACTAATAVVDKAAAATAATGWLGGTAVASAVEFEGRPTVGATAGMRGISRSSARDLPDDVLA